eukprot:4650984-Amphidinium_carterae.1
MISSTSCWCSRSPIKRRKWDVILMRSQKIMHTEQLGQLALAAASRTAYTPGLHANTHIATN